jgi:hypothetical protein
MQSVETWIAEIGEGCHREPIDWNAIRGASMSLDAEARTKEQKFAVEQLKRSSNRPEVERALIGVQQAFLDGRPGADGWPRRF